MFHVSVFNSGFIVHIRNTQPPSPSPSVFPCYCRKIIDSYKSQVDGRRHQKGRLWIVLKTNQFLNKTLWIQVQVKFGGFPSEKEGCLKYLCKIKVFEKLNQYNPVPEINVKLLVLFSEGTKLNLHWISTYQVKFGGFSSEKEDCLNTGICVK